ncbi:MAG: hypothetical protein CVV27_01095 [Candidatus Melainabacteria bacterium HGW-Melainabacteria-1]|nr:MAG: hypothetical protein CVV27_01095 [Candidatus Melainabacteria bacterium HGW-Melainabacteria-1]
MNRFETSAIAPVLLRASFLVEFTPESLRMVRKYRRLTQQALARLIGASADYISELERGRYQPSLDLLARLSEALKVVFFK